MGAGSGGGGGNGPGRGSGLGNGWGKESDMDGDAGGGACFFCHCDRDCLSSTILLVILRNLAIETAPRSVGLETSNSFHGV